MKRFCLLLLLLLAPGTVLAQTLRLTVTDEVMVPDVRRFGINLGNDAWFEGSILTKERILHGGFEGVLYRQLTFGPGGSATTAYDWFQLDKWQNVLLGAQSRFVTGPRAGPSTKVSGITSARYPERPDIASLPLYTFSDNGPPPESNDGLMFERMQDQTGYVGQHGGAWWVFTSGNGSARTVSGDIPPGSRGKMALQLTASGDGGAAGVLAPALSARWMRPQGRWKMSFWAKGDAPFLVYLGDLSLKGEKAPLHQTVTPDGQWRPYVLTFTVTEYSSEMLGAGFELTNGTLLLDEVSLIREGDGNPTAFRDEVVDALKQLHPGVLRHLQIGGSSLDNILEPRLSRLAFSSSRTKEPSGNDWPGHPQEAGRAKTHSYGLHEFLQLCAEIGADPWYCVPGTFTREEISGLVEYLSGPASTHYGAIRAGRGQQPPWTEVFGKIFIEIGNEAWNEIPPFLHGGYSRKGAYWDGLFATAKSSPHYTDRIMLVAGGQAVNAERNRTLLRETPQCDLFAVAPYLLHELSASEAAELGTYDLIRKALALPQQLAKEGWMADNYQWLSREQGKELAVYEVNHHITGGDAPAAIRNELVAGIAGGINVVHWMLLLLERFQVRVQNFFTFLQYDFAIGPEARVKLWGSAINLEPDRQRFRPTWLALQAVNSVLQGDLVRVKRKRRLGLTGYQDQVSAFATRDDSGFGLVLFNLDLDLSSQTRVSLPGVAGRDISRTVLAAASPTANNEPGKAPEVVLEQTGFSPERDQFALELPPCSMTVLNTRGGAQ